MVDVYRSEERVYDPVSGMMRPATPQQSWIDVLLGHLGRARGAIDSPVQRRAGATGLAALAELGDPTLPPPPFMGGLPESPPVITPTDIAFARRTQAPISAAGDPTIPPPMGTGMLPDAGVLPPLDRDRALPPLAAGPVPRGAMVPTPPAMLGGNNYAAGMGPTGAVAGSSSAYPDEGARAAGRAAMGTTATGGTMGNVGLGGIDLSGPTLPNAEAIVKLYQDQSGMAMRQGFQDAGIDPFKNPYAQSAINRYAQILPRLMEFFAIANGINPEDTASMATWVPDFIKKFMSGEINPQRLLQHAVSIAKTNPLLEQYLLGTGPDELLQLQGQVSGYGPRVEGARQRVIRERIARQQMAEMRNPAAPDVESSAWIDIIRGGAR